MLPPDPAARPSDRAANPANPAAPPTGPAARPANLAAPSAGRPARAGGDGRRGSARTLLGLALGLAVGLVAGVLAGPDAPGWLAPYLPVAVVAAIDALVGGLRAALERVFDDRVFVGSFLVNTAAAVLLAALGERLGVGGPLTTAVLIVFGIRIFTNVTSLRRPPPRG
ncbi:MAG: small basic family protein [Frankia sp.]|nr:small basic family protein [Frankia sp.]